MKAPVVNGERVLLRPLEPEDAPLLVGWFADPIVTREIEREPVTLEQEVAFIHRVSGADGLLASGIVERETGRLLGWIDLSLEPDKKSASFGIVVGDRTRWGQGFGTEATRLTLELAFWSLKLERVFLTVNASNVYAIRAYERAGFRCKEVRASGATVEGRPVDEWFMEIRAPTTTRR